MEHCFDAVERLTFEIHDLLLSVNDQAECDGLYAACGKLRLDFPPQYGRELETDQAVQYAARLLRVHEVRLHIPC